VVSLTHRPLYSRGRTQLHTEWEVGWALVSVWTFGRTGKHHVPTGLRAPEPPARSLVA